MPDNKKFIRCIHADAEYLEHYKVYEVLGEFSGSYRISVGHNLQSWYDKNLFEPVSVRIGECPCGGTYGVCEYHPGY